MPGPDSIRKPCEVNGTLYCDVICATVDTGDVPKEKDGARA